MGLFDESTFATPDQSIDLFYHFIRDSLGYNSYANTTVFKAIVLTEPVRLDEALISVFKPAMVLKKLFSLFGNSETGDKFIFRGRIDAENSPHNFTPDPCSIEFADNPEAAAKIITLHTLFASSDTNAGITLKVGDVVNVRLGENEDGTYNLQYGQLMGLSDSAPVAANGAACQKISELINPKDKFNFAAAANQFVHTLGGVLGQPYPNPDKYEGYCRSVCKDADTIIKLAAEIGIPPWTMAAFRAVESGSRTNVLRFEPHKFNEYSSKSMPFTNSGNGASKIKSETNVTAFETAMKKDPRSAVKATSFGSFQVMGHHLLKIESDPNAAYELFKANSAEVSNSLIKSWFSGQTKIVEDIKNEDWAPVAKRYNGPSYHVNEYHVKLATANACAKQCPEYGAST